MKSLNILQADGLQIQKKKKKINDYLSEQVN